MKHISDIIKMERIKIIYDDDVAVLDYLAELKDRRICRYIDDSYKDMIEQRKPNYAIVCKSRLDGLYVLILYNAPFGFCNGGNNLMLYAHSDIGELCRYFKRWMDSENSPDKAVQTGIHEITQLLYYKFAEERDINTQVNFLG